MNALKARDNFNTAMLLLDQAREEAAALPPISSIRTTADLVQRAKIVRSVLSARRMFQEVHQRAEGLSEALVRFRQRKDQINGKG
jgi:hypothetical protein